MRLFLAALLFIPVAAFGKGGVKPAANGKVYKTGDSATTVTVVELEPVKKGEVLLMVDKANSALDGLIILHKTKIQGQAQAYVMQYEGERTRMRAGDGYWYKQYSLYLPEAPTKEVSLYFDQKASEALDTVAFAKKYEAQDKKAVKAQIEKAYQ